MTIKELNLKHETTTESFKLACADGVVGTVIRADSRPARIPALATISKASSLISRSSLLSSSPTRKHFV
ncbi:MAG: hypothetical protein FGF53_04385 [Candidatus Brockarchaeota archaeon]|nr:hypothetical protein [Candidatus Brockarchaeota archaeon]MBO3809104.1 hypothetical protein [Candidatus Brockarchaeota archaeon]